MNRPIKLDSLIKNIRSFSLEWVFISAVLLVCGCVGCASLARPSLTPFLLLFSCLGSPLILCFRGKGYAVFIGIFLIFYVGKYVAREPLFIGFWLSGLGISFLLSYGLVLQGVLLRRKEQLETEQEQERLSKDLDTQRSAYQDLMEKRGQEKEFFDNRSQDLERKLSEYQELLKQTHQKTEYLAIDLKVLVDQKNSWLEDYAELHNKYIDLISKNENVVFPWMGGAAAYESQDLVTPNASVWASTLQDKEESLERLRQEILIEKKRCSHYESHCQQLRLSLEGFSDLEKSYKELEILVKQKEAEINRLHQLVNEFETKLADQASGNSLLETSSKEEKHYKDLYCQLQEQFIEKSETLSLVRKKLFTFQEKYLTLRKKEELEKQDISFDDISMIQSLLERIEFLEEEVSHLEELVSHSLSL
ncbi:hypothetical protein [Chlamydia serpentis]|uniref:hypothetical protein n=1 Tax=Chlamydia serpentis TaxID=1967782 RepID=UPI001E3DA693|nr:hypothetical protein [Chlamydia serpentis]